MIVCACACIRKICGYQKDGVCACVAYIVCESVFMCLAYVVGVCVSHAVSAVLAPGL